MSATNAAILVSAALRAVEVEEMNQCYLYVQEKAHHLQQDPSEYKRLARLGRITITSHLDIVLFQTLEKYALSIPDILQGLAAAIEDGLQKTTTTPNLPPDLLYAFVGGLSEEHDPTAFDKWLGKALAPILAAVDHAAAEIEKSLVAGDTDEPAGAVVDSARMGDIVGLAKKIGRDDK
ncbi:hypothetical protein B0H17DRAFT_1179374 [Mycena rosella]|uniref:Uncharacterized protein n=1 Tax=Mycena rosella TaxID=1033263 RepID=A0AAD7GI71_MYCRO|nr:hypothetical protein B0H17DRAFT_1179374 [Mycena rosella]